MCFRPGATGASAQSSKPPGLDLGYPSLFLRCYGARPPAAFKSMSEALPSSTPPAQDPVFARGFCGPPCSCLMSRKKSAHRRVGCAGTHGEATREDAGESEGKCEAGQMAGSTSTGQCGESSPQHDTNGHERPREARSVSSDFPDGPPGESTIGGVIPPSGRGRVASRTHPHLDHVPNGSLPRGFTRPQRILRPPAARRRSLAAPGRSRTRGVRCALFDGSCGPSPTSYRGSQPTHVES